MKGFGRVFRVGVPEGDSLRVLDGVRFPSGRCVLDDPERGLVHGAVSFEALKLPPGSEIEWADGGGQP